CARSGSSYVDYWYFDVW
nr:immunoglobulin heavy chain junction region [Mus musculus]